MPLRPIVQPLNVSLTFSFRRGGGGVAARSAVLLVAAVAAAVAVMAGGAVPAVVAGTASDTIRTACRTIPGLTRDQLDLCQRASDVTTVALGGLALAVRECQHQFRWHRWNCSALGTGGRHRNPQYSSTLLRKGKKQNAQW